MKFSDIPELGPFFKEKPAPLIFSGVQCDSRRVRPGDLFVALTGSRDDGARYAAAALANAVAAASGVRPRSLPLKAPQTWLNFGHDI